MNKRFFSFNLDFIGFSASLVCAAHCSLLPILIALSILNGNNLANEHFEIGLFSFAFVVVSIALFQAYKKHRNYIPIGLAILGFSILVSGHLVTGNMSYLISTIGGFAIAFAHWVNWKLTRQSLVRIPSK